MKLVHLTAEGLATVLAALVVIAVFMVVHAKQQRKARILAKYRRGDEDRDVKRMVADTLETINADARRFRAP